jgi:hypothetical protein
MTHRTATARQPPHRIRALARAIHACLKPGPTRHAASAASLALLLACPLPTLAADFSVANRNDSGPGSLRQAVRDANATPGPDTIRFNSSVTGTILLTSGALTVTDPLTLEGPGQDVLTIDGGAVSTILQVENSLTIASLKLANAGGSAINVWIRKANTILTVSDSIIAGSGAAGIAVDGEDTAGDGSQLIVEHSMITGNAAGGISTRAHANPPYGQYDFHLAINVSGSTISGNGGHGIDAQLATPGYRIPITIQDSTLSANDGDGVYLIGADLQIQKTVVSGNRRGGIHAQYGSKPWYDPQSSIKAANSVISDNGEGGVSGSFLTLSNSTIANNVGRGILTQGSWYGGGSASIAYCTIAGNQSGGIASEGFSFDEPHFLEVNNTTISGNHSPDDGAGIALITTDSQVWTSGLKLVSIRNSTITGNAADGSGGGIAHSNRSYAYDHDPLVLVENSIVAGNSASTDPDLSTAGAFLVDYALIEDPGSALFTTTVPGSNIIGQDPLLDPLANNGGPTQTHGLLPGSPALDRGDPNFTAPPSVDQRGEGFDRIVDGRIDIGAVEMQAGPSQPGGAWLRSLGDTNGDGTPEIAVVTRVDGTNRATVKDAANGALISRFAFNAALRPVDVETIPVFGQGLAPHLVLLGAAPTQAETRDALTGSLVGTVTFNPSAIPVDLTVLPDQDGNGNPELGMLTQGATTVEVRDARTGTLFNTLSFAPQLEPRQVLALPDLNRNGSAEVGVVLSDESKADRVVIKDTRTGAAIQTLWSGADLLQAAPVADRNRNGAPEVALLWRNPGAGTTQVWIVDAATNRRLASLAVFNQSVTPMKLAVVADVTGNRVEEYAVLGRTAQTGQATLTVLDGATGQRVSRMWYDPGCTPLDLVSIADVNGNGAPEVVMLSRCGPDGQLRAVINDTKSGQVLRRLNF